MAFNFINENDENFYLDKDSNSEIDENEDILSMDSNNQE